VNCTFWRIIKLPGNVYSGIGSNIPVFSAVIHSR
jgi:hypothetical protein